MSAKDLKTLSDRLLYALQIKNISQSELARMLKIKRQSVSYLCLGGVNKTKFANDIAEALNINVDWLVTGKGEMDLNDSPDSQFLSEQKVVPVIDFVSIEKWVSGDLTRNQIAERTVVHTNYSEKTYAVKLHDNAMSPRFEKGTVVIIDPEIIYYHKAFVLAYINNLNEVLFRQLIKEDADNILYAFNEEGYKQLTLRRNDQILGCMVEAKWIVH